LFAYSLSHPKQKDKLDLQICGRMPQSETVHIGKIQERHEAIPVFWSKWRDSNSRHPRLRRQLTVPDKIFGLARILDFIDRCASNASLYLPPAALGIFAQSRNLLCSQDAAGQDLPYKQIQPKLTAGVIFG